MELLDYDVIIVGAGPAGVSLAVKLSKEKDLRIALIDEKYRDKIGDKSCGDALMEIRIPDELFIPIRGELCQRWENHSVITGSEEIQGKSVFGSGYVVNRYKYNQRLLQLAEKSGTVIFPNRKVNDVIIRNDKVTGIKMRNLLSNQEEQLTGKIIVDASGWSHIVRRKLPQKKFFHLTTTTDYEKMAIGYREILEVEHDLTDHFYMIFLKNPLPPGSYFWILGHGKREVNAGIYIQSKQSSNNKKKSLNIKRLFKQTLHKHFFTENQYKVKDSKGCPIPATFPLTNIVGNGFVCTGDSAINVSPMTGEGFGSAIWASWNMGDAIIEALGKGDFNEEGLWKINKAILPLIKSNFVAYFRKKAFEGFGVNGLEICAKRIPNMLGDLFQDKKLPLYTQLKAAIKLHNLKLLGALGKIQLNSKRIDKILKEYPDKPDMYISWRKELRQTLIKCGALDKDELFDDFIQTIVDQREIRAILEPKEIIL